jgi:hypothetical protein
MRDTAWGSANCNVDNGRAVVIDTTFKSPPVVRIENAAPTGMRDGVGKFLERAGAFNAPVVALPTIRLPSKTARVKRWRLVVGFRNAPFRVERLFHDLQLFQ